VVFCLMTMLAFWPVSSTRAWRRIAHRPAESHPRNPLLVLRNKTPGPLGRAPEKAKWPIRKRPASATGSKPTAMEPRTARLRNRCGAA
jgi:hypothetical protein